MEEQRSIIELYENADQEEQYDPNNKSEKRRKRRKNGKTGKTRILTNRSIAFLTAGCIMLSGLFGFGGAALGKYVLPEQTVLGGSRTASENRTASNMAYNLSTSTGEKLSMQEVVAMNADAVVNKNRASDNGQLALAVCNSGRRLRRNNFGKRIHRYKSSFQIGC